MRPSIVVGTLRWCPALLLVSIGVSSPRPASAEVIRRLGGDSYYGGFQPVVSANGRFILRAEAAGGGVCGTSTFPTISDSVVYDLDTGRGDCVIVDDAGRGILGTHVATSISGDGQLVVFSSVANGLDPRCNGNGLVEHVYMRNRLTRHTECISITQEGAPGNGHSYSAQISDNGNVIVFWTRATNLLGAGNGTAPRLVVVRVVAGARQGPTSPAAPVFTSPANVVFALSADGRFVLFLAAIVPSVPGVGEQHVFRHDLETQETISVDVSATGERANGSAGGGLGFSADGRFAVFSSSAANLVPGLTPGISQVYRRDLATGEVVLVSRAVTGAAANGPGQSLFDLSADGRFIVFSSSATNLVWNDGNEAADVFVADLSSGISRITRLSLATDGVTEGNGSSEWGASISATGGIVAFGSAATNLDPDMRASGVFIARIPPVFENTVLTGAGFGGGPHVRSLSTGGLPAPANDFFAYDATVSGGVTVARGDLDDDGVPDIITGSGPGSPPVVRVFSGARSTLDAAGRPCPIELASFYAYDARFSGGVTVAVADVTGDGIGDIITGAGPGAGPHVRVFQARSAAATGPMSIGEYAGFFAYDPAFRGGVRVGAGDLDGNGVSEILTAAGPGASPHVQALVLNGARQPETVVSFYAYNPAFLGGVFVAAGDVDGDGREELITGADAGGSPHVRVFGTGPALTGLREVHSFFAYEAGFTGGVRVAAGDLDGDGAAEIVTAPGPWRAPLVRVFHTYANGALGEMSAFYAYDPGFSGGVFVAAPR